MVPMMPKHSLSCAIQALHKSHARSHRVGARSFDGLRDIKRTTPHTPLIQRGRNFPCPPVGAVLCRTRFINLLRCNGSGVAASEKRVVTFHPLLQRNLRGAVAAEIEL